MVDLERAHIQFNYKVLIDFNIKFISILCKHSDQIGQEGADKCPNIGLVYNIGKQAHLLNAMLS